MTIDVDWATEKELSATAETLIKNEVKSTWFLTHDSPQIQKILDVDLFEFGIHPNFMPDSTQGKTISEVMLYLSQIIDSKIVRMHRLYQYSNLFKELGEDYGMLVDVSIFLPETPNIQPHIFRFPKSSMIRIPYTWEDNLEKWNGYRNVSTTNNIFSTNGLKVFDFHPVHIQHDQIINNFFNEMCNEISGTKTKLITEVAEEFKRKL